MTPDERVPLVSPRTPLVAMHAPDRWAARTFGEMTHLTRVAVLLVGLSWSAPAAAQEVLLIPIAPQTPRVAVDLSIDLTLHVETPTLPTRDERSTERRERHGTRMVIAGPILLVAGYVLAAAWQMSTANDAYTLRDEGRERNLRFIPWVGPFLAMDTGSFGDGLMLVLAGAAQIAGTVVTVLGAVLLGTIDESEPFVTVEAGPTGLRVRGAF